jgi:hypothetical protein
MVLFQDGGHKGHKCVASKPHLIVQQYSTLALFVTNDWNIRIFSPNPLLLFPRPLLPRYPPKGRYKVEGSTLDTYIQSVAHNITAYKSSKICNIVMGHNHVSVSHLAGHILALLGGHLGRRHGQVGSTGVELKQV